MPATTPTQAIDNVTILNATFFDSYRNATTELQNGTVGVPKVARTITQTGHGLAVGNVIRFASGAYSKARADSAGNCGTTIGIVTEVADADTFTVVLCGRITGLTGLTANTVYYLSEATLGLLTSTAPSASGQFIIPILVTDSTTTGYVIPPRSTPAVIPVASGGTGQVTATAAFNALSPTTTLGDVIYHDGTDDVRLAGNITTTRKFMRQVGDGAASAAPVWDTLQASDIPSLSSTYQPLDATLTSIAALGTGANKMAYITGVDTWAETGLSVFGRTFIDLADAAAARANLDLEPGVDVQGYDADLAALAGVASNGLLTRTGAGTALARTLTGTSNQVTVTNGDGVAGNPTLSLPQDIHTTASPTFTGLTVTSVTGASGGGAITVTGGTATASDGSAGGAATYRSANGSSTASGGNGGALALTAGSAQGDHTAARSGGAVTITPGNGRGPTGGSAVTIAAATGGTSSTASGSSASSGGWTGAGGGNTTRTDGVAGAGGVGGAISTTGGTGGTATGVNAATNTGGNGGSVSVTGGTGGTASNGSTNAGGTGGAAVLSGGTGGVGTDTGGNGGTATIIGGSAAAVAGASGGSVAVTSRDGTSTGSGGGGGNVTITSGSAGGDNSANRSGGNIAFVVGAGRGATGGGAVNMTGGAGGTTTGGNGSAASAWTWTGSTGGNTARTDTNGSGGAGGAWTQRAGTGGTASGANSATNTGGSGGAVTLQAGTGGAATNGTTNNGGAGGQLALAGGVGGSGGSANGAGGAIVLQTASTTSLSTRVTIANNGVVTFANSVQFPTRSITSNRTLDETDYLILADATSGTVTVTLPAASGATGRLYRVKKTTAANTVVIDGNASETIDGATTQTLTGQYDTLTIQCDGSNWHIL